MTETKAFEVGAVYTAGSHMMTVDIDKLYEIASWFAGRSVMTHELLFLSEAMTEHISQHVPGICAEPFTEDPNWEGAARFNAKLAEKYGATIELPRFPDAARMDNINPLATLQVLVNDPERIIPIEIADE
jgi:hypothetical protein